MRLVKTVTSPRSVAGRVRMRVERGGERLWRVDDFSDLGSSAVMAELSRLSRQGSLRRVAKGVYYKPGTWALGETQPRRVAVTERAVRVGVHPAGLSAANVLGLTTQNAALPEVAVSVAKTPAALRGHALVHAARPSRDGLGPREVAVFEVLRDRGSTSDLTPTETVDRLIRPLRDRDTFTRLANAASSEPPRVRAMLGALGEIAGARKRDLRSLRATLNPLSRFDFGELAVLPTARQWQAKAGGREAQRT
jgi:hypothetical protein